MGPYFPYWSGYSFLGVGWLFYPEPWILDRAPNEFILKTSFKELFAADINKPST
ncbi:MAG: hypothetical protein Ct9H300mP2_2010 [Candidatus Neomarinimicrobiota bacterium]|nr:MAG: hypothetical protein Ct9H300mP2_2010 [Candidatus Neomarinimicrobiota bacterium]